MPNRTEEALTAAAGLLVALGRPLDAVPCFTRAAGRATDPGMGRDLRWAAVLHGRAGDLIAARRRHEDFVARYANDAAARDEVADARAWLDARPAPVTGRRSHCAPRRSGP